MFSILVEYSDHETRISGFHTYKEAVEYMAATYKNNEEVVWLSIHEANNPEDVDLVSV